jgi:signal transduction histidine kinase
MPESIPGSISAMEKDKQGYLWVSMTSGINRVNPKNNIFIHFDRVDGIANDLFILAASYTLPDGRLLFGADNQLVCFDPSKVLINDPAPQVHITGFSLMNKSLQLDSLLQKNRIELAPDDNSIAIEFSALRYNGTFLIRYMLEGLDKDWKVADKNNQAVYSYLPPGTYTFMVRSEDAEGNPSTVITNMVIRVRPPFWKTWWFLGLVIFAATAVLFWLDKLRMQKLRATESVRTRIATSLTEDMSSSLTNINISSELAKTKVDTDRNRTKEYIGQISEASNRMVQAMYDMVWSIDPKNDTVSDTIDRMKSFAGEIENTYPISVDFDIDRQVERLQLDMERRYELLCIFKEAVTNAAKHSDGRHIKVSIRYNRPKLMMMVIDDGKGFGMDDAAMLGRGISDMRRRAGAINAILYIESEINTGTVVKLELRV